ncbi:MAG: PAS domain S-box protein [Candidatus Methanofastidiosum sp.]|nr:PAS domain S-box protein [Methanofastidiosum sp.]
MEDKFHIPIDKINFKEYFSIFENINEAICINTKDGTIFFVNNSTLDLFGYSRNEMIGMNIVKLYANPKDRPNIINILEKQGFLKDYPVKLKKKDGKIIDCEFNTKITKENNDNKIFYGFIRNISERKKIEDKLKESEEKYRTLFENASDSIFLIKNGVFVDCNSKTLTILGYKKEEIIGKTPYDISPPIQPDGQKSKTKAKEKIEVALKGIPQFFEWRHIKSDGNFIDTEVSLNVLNLYDGKYLQAIVRDVTERKKANEIILENEEKFRSIFEATADIITYVDTNGIILDANSKVKDILGYERREIVGKNFRDLKLIDIEQLPSLIKLFIKTLSSGKESEKTEIALKNKNGDKVYFEVATQFINKNQIITGAVSIFRDISERKRINEALEKEKDNLYSLLNELPGYVCVYSPDLSIVFANNFLKKRFGKIEGKKCYEIFHGFKDCSEEPCNCCPVIRIFKTGISEKCERKQKDGKIYDIYDYPFTDLDGKNIVMEFGIDITEKKLAENKIIELNDTLRLLNKILRHDTLNNLMVISANIEMINGEEKDKINKAFEYVQKSAKLINRMKELESLVSKGFKLKSYDVKSMLNEISKNYSDIKIKIYGDCVVLADDALSSVFDNIIRNALIHGNSNRIDIKIRKIKDYCEVKFIDYGVGIPLEIKRKLFEEGFAYGKNKGTGLGLYIVKKTLERYGGSIEVQENMPKGAVFILRFRRGDVN